MRQFGGDVCRTSLPRPSPPPTCCRLISCLASRRSSPLRTVTGTTEQSDRDAVCTAGRDRRQLGHLRSRLTSAWRAEGGCSRAVVDIGSTAQYAEFRAVTTVAGEGRRRTTANIALRRDVRPDPSTTKLSLSLATTGQPSRSRHRADKISETRSGAAGSGCASDVGPVMRSSPRPS